MHLYFCNFAARCHLIHGILRLFLQNEIVLVAHVYFVANQIQGSVHLK